MVELVREVSDGGNRKFQVRLQDGAAVECVIYRGDSLCISSQVGCAVGCPFCASGANGLERNLGLDEMVGQVEAVLTRDIALRRVTISGVGEPLHNPEASRALVDWCRERDLGVSITTSGGPLRNLRPWLEEVPHRGVTLSVHAGTEPVRERTVPRGPRLDPLFEQLRTTLPGLGARRRRRLALAYLLVAGLNDDDDEIDAFIERARPLGIKTHLYRYNPVPSSPFRAVDDDRYNRFAARMKDAGLQVRQSSVARTRKNGGCGTLVALTRTGTAADPTRLEPGRP